MKGIGSLAGKRVFITGAASGIGFETALAFAHEGADIVAADVQEQGLAELAPRIEVIGQQCDQVLLDIADESAFTTLFAELASKGQLPDVVVNNAGIGFMGSFLDTDDAIWQRVLNINVLGVANGCRAFLQARGAIQTPACLVNVASAASIAPMPNMSAYAASKYAVEGFSEVLAMELDGSPVRVICVHPGIVNTPLVSNPALVRVPAEQLERLQAHYVAVGATPASVAQDIVAGVKSGTGTVFTGPSVKSTALLKRLLPRRWFRRLLTSKAGEIGYL